MTAVRAVTREFEKRRRDASLLRELRLREIYEKSPEVKEIDEGLVALGIEASKAILSGGDGASHAKSLAKESAALIARKREILAELGIGEDYIRDVYTCNICEDIGHTDNTRCACFLAKLIDEHYKFSGLSKVLSKENFDSFHKDIFSEQVDEKTGVSPRITAIKNLKIARSFVENFGTGENLFMYGDTGLGKTFLCNCIAKALLDAGRTVIYLTGPQMFKMVESVRFSKDASNAEKEAFLDMLPDVDLLIIDDLGTEVSTIVTTSELFSILNSRLQSGRSTVISTNFSISEITDIYSDRITSRLLGNYTLLGFAGEDLRIKLRYKM